MGANSESLVVVGLSGGVDSAVAALLLLEQGYAVHGLFMKNWEDDDTASHCSAAQDMADAKQVAADLNIPLHFANFSRDYKERVFARFLSEHRAGRTPNPDILCNNHIKFQAFPDYARRLGARYIATGHYARRLEGPDGMVRLGRAKDADKDQTYFLHGLSQAQLQGCLFPLGGFRKPDVRRMAEDAGLHNFDRRDSTGICFIGERNFRVFLQRYLPMKEGPILDVHGQLLGTHTGLACFTLGQRQGLGIGGRRSSAADAWYVAEKRLAENSLVVVQGRDHPLLFNDTLAAVDLHWLAGQGPTTVQGVSARIRHRQPDQRCRLMPDGNRCEVHFDSPQRAIAPGQSVVFYLGDVCIGGGTIERAWNRCGSKTRTSDARAYG